MRIKFIVGQASPAHLLAAAVAALSVSAIAGGCAQTASSETTPVSHTQDGKAQGAPAVSLTTPASALGNNAAAPGADSTLPKDVNLFADTWKILSERLYYEAGGATDFGNPGSRSLRLSANGKWEFGSSSGRWSVSEISPQDWERWAVKPYGPKRKITLSDWNKSTVDGPVEESAGRIDFLWVIYRADPPVVSAPGTIWTKFGHQ